MQYIIINCKYSTDLVKSIAVFLSYLCSVAINTVTICLSLFLSAAHSLLELTRTFSIELKLMQNFMYDDYTKVIALTEEWKLRCAHSKMEFRASSIFILLELRYMNKNKVNSHSECTSKKENFEIFKCNQVQCRFSPSMRIVQLRYR